MKKNDLLQTNRKERHSGIDLLRVVSMLMVLMLHILGYGGVLGRIGPGNSNYIAVWFLESGIYCAINCYAMISGYVGVDSTYRYSNLVMLWLQVVFYLLLGNLLFACFIPGSADLKTIIKSFMPFLRNQYWYFTAYCCLFLFMPLLNRLIDSLNRKQAAVVCVLIFLVFSVTPTLLRTDVVFQLGNGYSVHWLAMLYVVGGCVKKHDFLSRLPDPLLLLGWLLCAAAMVVSKLFIMNTSIQVIRDNVSSDILIEYISPAVFLSGLLLLVLCGKHPRLPVSVEKVLSVLAPASFSVYIMHAHPLVYQYFSKGAFQPYADYSAVGTVAAVVLTAVIVYCACAAVDTLRIRLFQALGLRKRLYRLEERLVGDLWKRQDLETEK